VEDVARMLLQACGGDLAPGEPKVVNIASGHPVSLRGFASEWWSRWNANGSLRCGGVPYRQGEVMRYVPEVEND